MPESVSQMFNIECRNYSEVNTDPMRRCYYGVHAKSEIRAGAWYVLEYNLAAEDVERRLEFWKSLNDIAVKDRGVAAKSDYRIVEAKGV